MFCTFGRLNRSCKTLRENLATGGYVIAVERLKDHVVPALRIRCPVPRSVKRDKDPVAVTGGKFALVIARHRVWCPMCRKGRYRRKLAGANSHSFAAIASIFRCEHQLFLK